MPLPRLTHLQFLVVSTLGQSAMRGRELRSHLRDAGIRQSGPAFYQMMAAMEDAGLVSGGYEQQVVDGQIIRERHYKVLSAGKKALLDCRDFYLRAIGRLARDFAFGP